MVLAARKTNRTPSRFSTPGRGAGFYNLPGNIQQNQPTTNADGQKVQNYVTVANDWFQVLTQSGRERKVFEQLRAEVTHLVRCRYSAQAGAISPDGYRIQIPSSGQVLNVVSAYDIDSRRVEIEMQCVEVLK